MAPELELYKIEEVYSAAGVRIMEIRCALCGKKMEINKMDKNFEAVRKGENPVIVCNMCQNITRYEAKKQIEKV